MAYELRISDWSSDVCSSDLSPCQPRAHEELAHHLRRLDAQSQFLRLLVERITGEQGVAVQLPAEIENALPVGRLVLRQIEFDPREVLAINVTDLLDQLGQQSVPRSEEHTSELQSLMRISYAVFCLKKKTDKLQVNKKT